MLRFKRLSRKYTASGHQKLKAVHPLKGHPFVLPVLTFLGLFFICSIGLVIGNAQTIGASDSRIIELTVDGEPRTVPTRAKTVADLLEKQQIKVDKLDIVTPALDTPILEDDMQISVEQARPVTIVDGDEVKTVVTPHRQNRELVEKAGVKLYPEDGITADHPELNSASTTPILGEQLVVDRATPASINLYGNHIDLRTRVDTVADLLKQKNIEPVEGDTIEPAPETKITKNIQVFIVRKGKKVITKEVKIPAPVTKVDDPTLAAGATVVKQQGKDGKKLVTYEIQLKNGKEAKRRVLHEVIATRPTRRVVAHGTKALVTGTRADWLKAVGISPSEYYAVDYIIGRESGWCPTKWQGEYGGCPKYHGAPGSGIGYGLCQATPGNKMSSAGADWAVNPVTQLKWCTGYARTRYGSWPAAYTFWKQNHWW